MPRINRPAPARVRSAAFLIALGIGVAVSSSHSGRSLALTNGGNMTAFGTPLVEDFNTLASTGTTATWTDNATIPGWYSTRTAYTVGTGSSSTGALYSFGVAGVGPVDDRALGSVGSGSTGTVYWGVKLTNNTGGTITSLDISYVGEQWRNGGATSPALSVAQSVDFQYQVAGAGVISAVNTPTTGWLDYDPLDFTSPTFGTSAAATLDGNAGANRVPKAATLSIAIANGQEVWLRWKDIDHGGNDHGFAIDDFSVTPHGVAADTEPAVTGTTPANNATSIPLTSTIVINFNEGVNAAGGAFALACPTGAPQTFTVSSSPASSFTLTPVSPLPANTTCTVTVTAAQITDADPNDPPDHPAADVTFSFTTGAVQPPADTNIIINEVDSDQPSTDTAEFIELYDGGRGFIPLNGLVLVFFNGSNDQAYAAFDLDGYVTDANGYFTIGNPGVAGVDLVFDPATSGLQNGADAVALYIGNASDFPAGAAATTANLLDAFVYGTADPDDPELLTLLNPGELQVNETANGTQSNQRCPNGTGGARNSSTYLQAAPSPDGANTCPAPPQPSNSAVVISQLYGGGGNTLATYQNDYVELYNRTASPVDITGWSLQYASATGSGWAFTLQPLGGSIGPGQYLLISLASSDAIGAPLPPANINGQINLSGTSGKVALVNSFDALVGNCPVGDPHIVDFVGYGSADCREGTSTAPSPSNTTALFRLAGGSTDTDRNGNDFITDIPAPRRTAPIVELGPLVLATDPRPTGFNAPRDATIQITFTEPVNVIGVWFDIACAGTGQHNSATVAVTAGGQNHFITPNVDFQAGEQCTVTLFKDQISDADVDDAGPNTDTLPANFTWSFTVATGTAPPYPPSEHLAMGNPSSAAADTNQPDNYLMQKAEYALSYNRSLGRPNWVSWHLSDEWIGSLQRVDSFRADPRVPPQWYRVQSFDFTSSGFDRGHMVPNADRDKETSIPINQATFLMTNMLAQAPDNNQGPWAAFEGYLRTLLPADEIYIVAGGTGTGGTGSNGGVTTTIANGNVNVPAFTWKVALVIPKGIGDANRVSCSSRTIAVKMPNVQGIRFDPWENFLTTVDAIEALTGYDFFTALPLAFQACVEAGINGVNPPLDTDAPIISCGSPDGQWHALNVSLPCVASDGGSGLANAAADASFSLATSVAAGTEDANASTNSRVVCDVAGNCATAVVLGNKIDRKAPDIVVTSPASLTYLIGQPVTASYTCTDGGSGPGTCSGPVASGQPISTSAPGAFTFVVTASDAVGNTSSQTVSYSVGFNVCALYDQTKAHKAGSTVPIKLQVCDAQGVNYSSSSRTVLATSLILIATSAPGVLEDSGNANPDNQFRFDATVGAGGGYVFNLKTTGLAQGTYGLVFTISGDASTHMVQFQVR